MKSVGSRELKNRLGAYLRQVREGTTILVTDRGRPIAELRPLAATANSEEEALASLAADGLVSPPTSDHLTPDYEPLRFEGQSLSAAIIEERRDRL
jgi:prevent-host-death family protein